MSDRRVECPVRFSSCRPRASDADTTTERQPGSAECLLPTRARSPVDTRYRPWLRPGCVGRRRLVRASGIHPQRDLRTARAVHGVAGTVPSTHWQWWAYAAISASRRRRGRPARAARGVQRADPGAPVPAPRRPAPDTARSTADRSTMVGRRSARTPPDPPCGSTSSLHHRHGGGPAGAPRSIAAAWPPPREVQVRRRQTISAPPGWQPLAGRRRRRRNRSLGHDLQIGQLGLGQTLVWFAGLLLGPLDLGALGRLLLARSVTMSLAFSACSRAASVGAAPSAMAGSTAPCRRTSLRCTSTTTRPRSSRRRSYSMTGRRAAVSRPLRELPLPWPSAPARRPGCRRVGADLPERWAPGTPMWAVVAPATGAARRVVRTRECPSVADRHRPGRLGSSRTLQSLSFSSPAGRQRSVTATGSRLPVPPNGMTKGSPEYSALHPSFFLTTPPPDGPDPCRSGAPCCGRCRSRPKLCRKG
jgi:hypothetical protein